MEFSIKNEIIKQRLLEGGVSEDEVNKIFEGIVIEETKKEENNNMCVPMGTKAGGFCQHCGFALQTITFPKSFDVNTGQPYVGLGCANNNCINSSIHHCDDRFFRDCSVCGFVSRTTKNFRWFIWIFFCTGIASTIFFGTIAIMHYIF